MTQPKAKHQCLLCGELLQEKDVYVHKETEHSSFKHYGLMWPLSCGGRGKRRIQKIPTYDSPLLAKEIGVRKVYIRDEGQNPSGSMKDYIVRHAVRLGLQQGFRCFSVVSSGNHAVSLAKFTAKNHVKAVVFTPASSSKLSMLASFRNVVVVAIQNAIFEDVYKIGNSINLPEVYNANVSNEFLLEAFCWISQQILNLTPLPTHILAGVGNGTYLAGIGVGLQKTGVDCKIIPVGMKGAFPTEEALNKGKNIVKYEKFLVKEELIYSAEGSIAIESYSMPQLVRAVRATKGFALGGLTNQDLRKAYMLLAQDKHLIAQGAIPEPTGIMGLAAALKYKERFGKDDVLLISFTGHGVKSMSGIQKLVPDLSDILVREAMKSRPDLISREANCLDRVLFFSKNVGLKTIKKVIDFKLKEV